MIVFRRRLIFWLIKAYIKKWGRVILLSFGLGLIFFFAFLKISGPLFHTLQIHKRPIIGMTGLYTTDTLPPPVVAKLSRGLTRIDEAGEVQPDLATSWNVSDNGKTYTFFLKKDVFFNDDTQLTSDSVTYSFADVKVERPNRYTITYKLKDEYAPFLVTASRPLLKKGLVGIGDYKVDKIELNGNFIQSLRLTHINDSTKSEDYQIYPTQEALKVAMSLGEVTKAVGLTDAAFRDSSFETFKNIETHRTINYSQLVTLFYNNRDKTLSDKKLRAALSYAMPNSFLLGKRSPLPYPEKAWFFHTDMVSERIQDYDHAKELMPPGDTASASGQLNFTMKVLSRYKTTADEVKKAWEPLGVTVTIEEVEVVPTDFQMYLGDFLIPKDPDQYTLWHSDQRNNITQYKNLRIDKLLEDGRKIVDIQEREQIYKEFQKYLLDDSPASFLYYPYEYHLTRK